MCFRAKKTNRSYIVTNSIKDFKNGAHQKKIFLNIYSSYECLYTK